MSMLEVQNLSVRFGSAVIVNDVSFSVQDGDWLMLIGPNGAGKSTIVNAVSRGVPYTGTVLFEGKDVQKTPAHLLARGMGVLAQHHTVGYAFSVEEVVRLGRYAYAPGIFSRRSDEDERSVAEAMELTGVAHIARQSVLTLSGGEPFEQCAACLALARKLKERGYGIWAYSGYLYEDLASGAVDPLAPELLACCDVLVDGPFVQALNSYDLKWKGSSNQRVIDLAATRAQGRVVLWQACEEFPEPPASW